MVSNREARGGLLTEQVIGAAIDVHRALGPGLLESTYRDCFCQELFLRGIPFQREVPVPLEYKGIAVPCGFRLDVLVADFVLLELKSVSKLLPIHEAQLLTYLRLRRLHVGLLINFNVTVLKNGIRRLVNSL